MAKKLRSQAWFGRQDIYGFIYRSWVTNRGVPHDQFDGRMIALDVAKRSLELLVPEKELAARRKRWKPPKPPLERGYWRLYFDHVLQANEGADLDFLAGKNGDFVPRDNH